MGDSLQNKIGIGAFRNLKRRHHTFVGNLNERLIKSAKPQRNNDRTCFLFFSGLRVEPVMGEAVLLISLSRRNSFSMSKSMAISISKSAAASTSISMLNSNGRRHYYLNRDGVTHSFLFFIGEPPQPSPNSLASSSPIPPPISKPSDAPKKSSSNPKPKPPSNWEEDGGIGPLPFIDTSNEAERRWS